MKRALGVLSVFALLTIGLAWAAPQPTVDPIGRWVQGQLCIGSNKPTSCSTANQVTRWLGASSVIDVATATGACNDSAGVTLTGAKVGDPCSVGAPTTITGAGTGLSASFTCYVSAADTVVLRHCVAGVAADDPASATWYFRVISSQP